VKGDFFRLAIDRYEQEKAGENERLAAIPEYVALKAELQQVQSGLVDGQAAVELARLHESLVDAEIRVTERDLDFRVVKSEIEEGWYLLEKAQHEGGSGDAEHAHLQALEKQKSEIQVAYNQAVEHQAEVQAQIDNLRAREEELAGSLREWGKGLDALDLKLDAVSWSMFGRRVPKVPTVEQVVLPAFERNNFEQWVDRVERCTNCHVAIDRAGFEDLKNPMKTHPNRAYYIGKHEGMGCTPCHGGQGASINSVEQAHGKVPFWEDPLLDPHERAQSKCINCHLSAQGIEGASKVARGEQLFRDLGCHGCHLVKGFGDLPKAGPSLERIAAKASPEWIVSWVEKPKAFRARTRMPHFFLSREESVAITAYLLFSSSGEAKAWSDLHATPEGVNPKSAELVAQGEKLTRTLGCLGCHGFKAGEYASEVAVGMDTAPNLARIAEKTDTRWMYHWIRNPREFSSTARMPRLRLSHDEARAITSYLGTLKEEENPEPDLVLRAKLADPTTIAEGGKLIRKYGCFGCHGINGMEAESRVSVELSAFAGKHVEELFFGDRLDIPATWEGWTVNKLLTPRTYETERIEQNMPEFGFSEEDARALMIFLGGHSDKKVNEKYLPDIAGWEAKLKRGREVVAYYNCNGCHSFDGQEGAVRRYFEDNIENAPPILVGEGKKVQPEWFFDFIMKPVRLRPWLDVRMPTFGLADEEATAVVDYFGALDGYELGPVVLETGKEAHTALIAHREQPEEYFDCYSCHPRAGRVQPRDYVVSRKPLTPEQIHAWMVKNLGVTDPAAKQSAAVEKLPAPPTAGGN
jgi:mono/diheme cytochrome c family protein